MGLLILPVCWVFNGLARPVTAVNGFRIDTFLSFDSKTVRLDKWIILCELLLSYTSLY